MDLITVQKYKGCHDYINELTKVMDQHIIGGTDKLLSCLRTYIYGDKPNHHGWYSFRFPGATRGGIKVDADNVIEKIEFFKDITLLYEDSVEEAVKQFIGAKIIIKKD